MVQVRRSLWLFSGVALLAGSLACGGRSADNREPLPAGTSVLLLTLDTFREDRMGVGGRTGSLTPTLDSLAARGVYFSRCYAQSSWTLPSMLSLISSLPPATIGVHKGVEPMHKSDPADTDSAWSATVEYFSESHVTMAEIFRQNGYRTVGISTNGHLIRRQGFAQGFDRFDETTCMWENAQCALDRAWEEVRAAAGTPLFLLVHLVDPHFDKQGDPPRYLPENGYEDLFPAQSSGDRVERTAADYDAGIRYMDDQIGIFLDRLERAGLLESFLVVVAADHGEEFFEKGRWGHSRALTNTLVHVPLIFCLPGNRRGGRTVESVVGNMDVMPTILSLVGAPLPEAMDGIDLSNRIHGERGSGHEVYGETRRGAVDLRFLVDPRSELKLVLNMRNGQTELYALSDSAESRPLQNRKPEDAADLEERLRDMLQSMEERAVIEMEHRSISSEEVERLRGLGYVGGN